MGASSSKEYTTTTSGGTRKSSSPLDFSRYLKSNVTYCDVAPPPLPPIAPPSSSDTKDSSPPPPPPPPPTSQSTPPPPPPSAESSAPPPPPSEPDAIEAAAANASSISNPGPFEHATMDAKRLVSIDTYDGFRLDINKQLSPFMAVVHSFWLGTSMLPDGRNKTYTFLTQVADEAGLCMARVDLERQSVDGRIHRALLGGLVTSKVQIGVSAEGQTDQLLGELDFGGATWCGNLKYGSMGGGLVYGCNYIQSITSNWVAGGEGMYISANQSLLSNYMMKYTMEAPTIETSLDKEEEKPTSTMIASYNSAQSLLCFNYKRVVTPKRVTLGAELQCQPASLESAVMVGGEFAFTRSKVGVVVDGSGRIQSTLETKLGREPGSPSLTFAAELDHGKNVMRFGYGLNIG